MQIKQFLASTLDNHNIGVLEIHISETMTKQAIADALKKSKLLEKVMNEELGVDDVTIKKVTVKSNGQDSPMLMVVDIEHDGGDSTDEVVLEETWMYSQTI